MMSLRSSFAALACACALASCAAPRKALVMARVPEPSVKAETGPALAASDPVSKPLHDDGFRTGDLLGLPKDTEYRATNPALPKANAGAGTVIVTPPSAPKPKPQNKPED